jgi:virginiamycin B lyase
MPLARLFRGLGAALMTALATPAAAGAIDEFPLPAGTQPGGITAGSDGALWFLEEGPSSIGRITTGGAVTGHFAVNAAAAPPDVSSLDQITLGPDGNLWFTQPADDQIGRMTIPSGAVTEYNVPNADNEPEGITVGPDGAIWFTAAGRDKIGRIPVPPPSTPTHGITMYPSGTGTAGSGVGDITAADGALWFTEGDGNRIGKITTGGAITHPGTLTAPSEPSAITAGPDGRLWFAEALAGRIAAMTTGGQVEKYPGAGVDPSGLAVGQDGAIWFTDSNPAAGVIGRITTAGVITDRFPVPTANGEPSDITAGPDGALWFTEFASDRIGRIQTAAVFTEPSLPPLGPGSGTPAKKKACKVPRVRGLMVRKAKRKLRRANCRHRVRGRGRVVWTKPKAGRRTTKIVRVMAKPRRPRR